MSTELYLPERDFLNLLKNVDATGRPSAKGELFTFKELCSYLKEYIKTYELFDKSDPKVVHCQDDPLGRVFDVSSFTLYEAVSLISKHVVKGETESDKADKVQTSPQISNDVVTSTVNESDGHDTDDVVAEDRRQHCFTPPHVALPLSLPLPTSDPPLEQQEKKALTSETNETSAGQTSVDNPHQETATPPDRGATSQHAHSAGGHGTKRKRHHRDSVCSESKATCREGRSGEEDRPVRRRASSISLVVDEWSDRGGSSYEWWQYVFPLIPSSDDSEILSIQSKETVLVKSSSDDAWSTEDELELAATVDPPFTVEYDVDSDHRSDSHLTSNSDSDSTEILEGVYIVVQESDVEWWADSESSESDYSTDSDLADEDKWTCQECDNKNSPLRRNCDRCMVVRPNWLPPPRTGAPSRPRHRKARTLNLGTTSSSGEDECDGPGGEPRPQLLASTQHTSRVVGRTSERVPSDKLDSDGAEGRDPVGNVRTSEGAERDVGTHRAGLMGNLRTSGQPQEGDEESNKPLEKDYKHQEGHLMDTLQTSDRNPMGNARTRGRGLMANVRTSGQLRNRSRGNSLGNHYTCKKDAELHGTPVAGNSTQEPEPHGLVCQLPINRLRETPSDKSKKETELHRTPVAGNSTQEPEPPDPVCQFPIGHLKETPSDSGLELESRPCSSQERFPMGGSQDSGVGDEYIGSQPLSQFHSSTPISSHIRTAHTRRTGQNLLANCSSVSSGSQDVTPGDNDSTAFLAPGTDSGTGSLNYSQNNSAGRDGQRVSLSNFQIPLSSSSLKRGHSDPLPTLSKTHSPDGEQLKKAKSESSVEGAALESANLLCKVCFTNPKNASIIHGNTGHQVCCYSCAKKLRRRGKTCPVCRRKIQKVVRNFIV